MFNLSTIFDALPHLSEICRQFFGLYVDNGLNWEQVKSFHTMDPSQKIAFLYCGSGTDKLARCPISWTA
jgi:hypothetical protein